MVKEVKDGKCSERLQLLCYCENFEVCGDRTVAFVGGGTVAVYEQQRRVHTGKHLWGNSKSVHVSGSKVYFPGKLEELIELDVETLEEKLLLHSVNAITAAPGDGAFLAVSKTGVLSTERETRDLQEVFPKMKHCNWGAALTVGGTAVVAGQSSYGLLEGNHLYCRCNFFLLLHAAHLRVFNEQTPLAVMCSQGGRCSLTFSRRVDQLHAML